MITVYGLIGPPSAFLQAAAASAQVVVGGRRHLDALGVPEARRIVLGPLSPAIEALSALPADAEALVVASGDPLFYGVVRRMRAASLPVRVVPEVGSLQAAFAAVAVPWDDALLVSAHGNDPAPALRACGEHPKVGVLTDHRNGLPQIVAATTGLGRWYVLGERLGEADEQIRVLNEAEAIRVTDPAQPHVVLVLAHHPDDPEVLGTQQGIAGGLGALAGASGLKPAAPGAAGPTRAEGRHVDAGEARESGVAPGDVRPAAESRPRVATGEPVIGQLTNSPAARAHADAIDAALAGSTGTTPATRRFDGRAAEHLATAWAECDLIVSHLALGATTRLIAPLLADKKTDPGVVVVDETGRFVVPLVGGHVGGANELARRIAAALDATAVVTTATDGNDIPGLDTLGWATTGDLAGVTRALLDSAAVELVRERPWPMPALPTNVTEPGVPRVEYRGTHVTELPPPPPPVARIVVTDSASAQVTVDADVPTVALHPKSLVVGMGCNSGTSAEVLEALLDEALAEAGLSKASIRTLTSVDAKADEAGLAELAARLGVPFTTHPAERLAGLDVPNPSDAPLHAVGTPSVAEASVLAEGAVLVLPKRKNPEATVAIGRLEPRGTLAVVGLGPGADDLLAPRARDRLRAAAVVVGYRPYVAQIRHLLRPGTEILGIGMGTEQHRIEFAIAKAREGRSVALVCGGDPAIYAMASPTLEQGTEGIDVEVVPGVTAELAASAILGAPLGHDHVTISLSDLHTDWGTIERRLTAAAEGDFVVALYNPRSRKRVMQLPRALEILGAHRPADTPVAVVQDASRPDENHRIAPLAEFEPEWVDMHSIVIVGSSTTRMIPTGVGAHAMVTPRDYQWMDR